MLEGVLASAGKSAGKCAGKCWKGEWAVLDTFHANQLMRESKIGVIN